MLSANKTVVSVQGMALLKIKTQSFILTSNA